MYYAQIHGSKVCCKRDVLLMQIGRDEVASMTFKLILETFNLRASHRQERQTVRDEKAEIAKIGSNKLVWGPMMILTCFE